MEALFVKGQRRFGAVDVVAPCCGMWAGRYQVIVYACPDCQTRYLGQQRCDDCNTFAARLGPAGPCPDCDTLITLEELLQAT